MEVVVCHRRIRRSCNKKFLLARDEGPQPARSQGRHGASTPWSIHPSVRLKTRISGEQPSARGPRNSALISQAFSRLDVNYSNASFGPLPVKSPQCTVTKSSIASQAKSHGVASPPANRRTKNTFEYSSVQFCAAPLVPYKLGFNLATLSSPPGRQSSRGISMKISRRAGA